VKGKAMMIIDCKQCGKKYKVDETRITGNTARFRCNVCDNVMVVNIPAKPEVDEIDVSPVEEPVSRAGQQPPPGPAEVPDRTKFKIKWRDSIQFRTATILIILTALIFAAFILVSYQRTKDRMDTELSQLAQITTTRLANSLVGPLWDLDDKQMKATINSEMMEQRIYAVLVKDMDGKTILSGLKRDSNWKIADAKQPVRGNYVKSSKKIQKDDELIGSVETYITSRFMQEEFNRSVFDITVTALVLIVAILLAIIFTFRTLLVRPIMKLTNAAAQMSVGDLNVEIDVKSKNEIGLLAGAIERMQESLRLAMDRLRRRTA
jgi:methyl-accepting chemotaxis protein